jgi:hypothetical protein
MPQRIEMGTDVATKQEHLIGRRPAVGPNHVAVPPHHRQLECGMIGRDRHATLPGMSQIDHPGRG